MKEDKFTKSLAKNQVYAIVHMREFFLEELIRIKVIFILRQGIFREQNLQNSVMFLTHIRAVSLPPAT